MQSIMQASPQYNAQHIATRPNPTCLVMVFLSLSILTCLSYWIANSALMENRLLAWGSMLAVSITKAALVGGFFMHLWWERAWKYVLTIPAMIMGCLLVILLIPDIAFRTNGYSLQRRQAAPEINPFDGMRLLPDEFRDL